MTRSRLATPRTRPAERMRLVLSGALFSLALLPASAIPQDYSLDFYTIDGGGEILAESDDQQVQLSGTLGQWDTTESLELAGSGYTLTGGFWPVNIDQTDRLFRDGFEG